MAELCTVRGVRTCPLSRANRTRACRHATRRQLSPRFWAVRCVWTDAAWVYLGVPRSRSVAAAGTPGWFPSPSSCPGTVRTPAYAMPSCRCAAAVAAALTSRRSAGLADLIADKRGSHASVLVHGPWLRDWRGACRGGPSYGSRRPARKGSLHPARDQRARIGNLYCASCYGRAAKIAGCALAVIALYAPEDGAQLVRIAAGDGGNRSLPPTGRQANAPGIHPKAFRIRLAFRSGSGRCQALTRELMLAIRSCRRLIRFTNGERAALDETPGPGEPNVSTLEGLCRSISGVALA